MAETAEALESAERCGDDFALDSARLSHGMVLVNGDAAHRPAGFEFLDQYREASVRHGYTTNSVRFVDTETAKERARLGDFDGAIEMARTVVDFLFNTGDMTSRGPAVSVLAESLLRRGTESDVAEATARDRPTGCRADRSRIRAARTAVAPAARAPGARPRRRERISGSSRQVSHKGECPWFRGAYGYRGGDDLNQSVQSMPNASASAARPSSVTVSARPRGTRFTQPADRKRSNTARPSPPDRWCRCSVQSTQ